jgi:hypothetical protein
MQKDTKKETTKDRLLRLVESNVDNTNCDGCGKPIDSNDEDSDQIPIENGRHVIDVMKLCGECAMAYQEKQDALEERATMEDDE